MVLTLEQLLEPIAPRALRKYRSHFKRPYKGVIYDRFRVGMRQARGQHKYNHSEALDLRGLEPDRRLPAELEKVN